eukprot:gene2728-3321_t
MGVSGANFPDQVRHPFNYCPRDALSVLMMSTPFCSVEVKKAVNDIILTFQHDDIMKRSFTCYLTLLYPSLNTLFNRGIGTAEDTIFNLSVQASAPPLVYTSDSVVDLLSSDTTGPVCEQLTALGAQNPIHITRVLTSSLLRALADIGCVRARVNDHFLRHSALVHRRLWHVFKDLEYVTESFVCAVRVLAGRRDPKAMDDWIQLCVLLQEVDRHQRRQGLHVEYESDSWEVATNLLLDLESVSTTLIGAALLPALDKLDIPAVGGREGNSARSLRVMLSDLRLEAAEKMLLKGLEALVHWYQGLDEKRKGVLVAPLDCAICGHSAYLPGERVFRVSREAVSIHIPVHRMIAKVVLFSAMGNVPKATMFTEFVRSNPECVTILVDFPIRCLVFAAQIRLGMWRRNGITVENIGHNYSRMPVCRTLQDADIVALQWGIYCNSFCFSENNNLNSIFALLLRRFEVLGLLSKSIPEFEGLCASVGKPGSQQALAALENSGGLLAELFRLLIIVVTYVPTPLYTSV